MIHFITQKTHSSFPQGLRMAKEAFAMAKKKAKQDVRDDPRYHDTRKLLKKYRDVT